jgi:hypothetical protein
MAGFWPAFLSPGFCAMNHAPVFTYLRFKRLEI